MNYPVSDNFRRFHNLILKSIHEPKKQPYVPKIFKIKKLCLSPKCFTKNYAHNLCEKHYARWYYNENLDKKRNYSKIKQRVYRKSHQISGSISDGPELRKVMNKVRKKFNNTCQWLNCGVTSKEVIIDVHHIFPRAQYPELELVERFLITYCRKHHNRFHQYRGYKYQNILNS